MSRKVKKYSLAQRDGGKYGRSTITVCGFYRNYQGIRIIKVPEKVTWHYLKTWKTLPDFRKSSTFAHVHSFINGPQWTLRPSPRSLCYVPFIIIFENSQFFNTLGVFYHSIIHPQTNSELRFSTFSTTPPKLNTVNTDWMNQSTFYDIYSIRILFFMTRSMIQKERRKRQSNWNIS